MALPKMDNLVKTDKNQNCSVLALPVY